ncbi:early-responsive to dehydration stress protein (ERD4) isoform X2 [Wolffia australiana]
MEVSSFLTSFVSYLLVFVVLMLLFSWLSRSPANEVVYYPSRVAKGLNRQGLPESHGPLSWIREAISASEEDIVAMAGVDAAVYLIFLSTALGILVISGLVLVPVLLPVAKTDFNLSLNKTATFNVLDELSMANIKERSPRLWAFLISTYWVTFVAFYFLWNAYSHVSKLRAAAKSNADIKPEDVALLVRDIPPVPNGQTRKEQVDAYFSNLYPDTFYRSMVITDHSKARMIWEELEGFKTKLARAEVVFSESKTTKSPEGLRPKNKTGFLGLLGEEVDTIDYCQNKIKELTSKLEAEQKTTLREKQLNAAIVVFNGVPAAAAAAQSLQARTGDRWLVSEAPEPREIIWPNLAKLSYERKVREIAVYGIVFLTVVFYMIPIGLITAFTTLDNLKKYLPFTKPVVDIGVVRTALEAYLPQIALIVFLALLPKFLLMLSRLEGIPSQSHVVRAASGKYFYFIIFNVFLGVTVGGALFKSFKQIEKNPNSTISLLGSSLPGSATFFLTFVALQFFVGDGLELSRLVPLILYRLKRKFLCKTEKEIKAAWAPGDLGYATRVPNDMLIVTIVLCYAVIAPLIIPFGVLYFGISWLVFRNQALKVYIAEYESYGRMWPHMHKRILAALVIYQLTMIGYFGPLLRRF